MKKTENSATDLGAAHEAQDVLGVDSLSCWEPYPEQDAPGKAKRVTKKQQRLIDTQKLLSVADAQFFHTAMFRGMEEVNLAVVKDLETLVQRHWNGFATIPICVAVDLNGNCSLVKGPKSKAILFLSPYKGKVAVCIASTPVGVIRCEVLTDRRFLTELAAVTVATFLDTLHSQGKTVDWKPVHPGTDSGELRKLPTHRGKQLIGNFNQSQRYALVAANSPLTGENS